MKKMIASILLGICTLTMAVSAESAYVVGSHTLGQNGVELDVTFDAAASKDPAVRGVLLVYDAADRLCYMDAQKSNGGQLAYQVKLPSAISDGAYRFCINVDGSVQEYKEITQSIFKADSNITYFNVEGEVGATVSAVCRVKSAEGAPAVLIAVYDNTSGMLVDAASSSTVTDNTITASLNTSGKDNITVKGYIFESLENVKPLTDSIER